MKIFNKEIIIRDVEKETKAMTAEDADIAVDGVCPDVDPEPKKEKKKKGPGKKILCVVGAIGAAGVAGFTILSKLGSDPEKAEEDSGDDFDDREEAPFEAAEPEID